MNTHTIEIEVGRQMDGLTFRLSPESKDILRGSVPDTILNSKIFISYDTKADFESTWGAVWEHVAMLLTGLPLERLRQFGRVRFVDRSRGNQLLFSK